MDEDQRPGGLTALAVFNFIFTALFTIGLLISMITYFFGDQIPTDNMTPAQKEQFENFINQESYIFIITIAPLVILIVLLLLSGIGYLQRKSFLGRDLGNIYAVLAIVSGIATPFISGTPINKSALISMAIGMIYPIITLLLLNLKYKKYFIEESSASDIENLQV